MGIGEAGGSQEKEDPCWSSGGIMRTEKNMVGNMRPDSEHLEWDEEKVGFPFHSQVLYHYGKPFKFAPCSQDLPSFLIKATFGCQVIQIS